MVVVPELELSLLAGYQKSVVSRVPVELINSITFTDATNPRRQNRLPADGHHNYTKFITF